MTQPAQARQSGDGVRTYPWPPTEPYEFEVISVTSALKALPKPFLIGWAAKLAAFCAVDDHDIITAFLAKGQEKAAINHIKEARFRDMDDKADRGTIVHAAIEAYLTNGEVDKAAVQSALDEKRVPRNMHESAFGMIQGVLAFLQDYEPEVYWAESTVYSRKNGYAGTADILGRFPIGGTRLPTVIDVKTSKAIYDEVALQLIAYARADFVGLNDGAEAALTPTGEPIDYGVVVRPMADGTYERAVFAFSDALYDRFLAVLAVAKSEGLERRARRPR